MLAKICGTIASDEGRHEQAYQRVSDSEVASGKQGSKHIGSMQQT